MRFCFWKLHNWIEPPETTKQMVVDYLLSNGPIQWLHVVRIEVCAKCQKIRVLGSSFLGLETRILKKVIDVKGKEEEQEQDYVVVVEEQDMTITDI